jgi:hypothetical protein
MIASKSSPQGRNFDTFNCLRCDTVISTAPTAKTPKRDDRA